MLRSGYNLELSRMEFSREQLTFYISTRLLLGETTVQIYDELVKARPGCIGRSTFYKYCQELKESKKDFLTDTRGEHSGRQKTVRTERNINLVKKLMKEDPHLTVDAIAEELSISAGSVYTILTEDLGMKSLTSKWIPHKLMPEHKEQRLALAHEWIKHLQQKEQWSKIIFVDEKYVYLCTPGHKQANRCWVEDKSQKTTIVKKSPFDRKVLIIVAVTFIGKCHIEILKKHETVNSERYVTFLKNMIHNFSRQQDPLTWTSCILIHDNARPHTSQETKAYLQSQGVSVLQQPVYSPDFNLLDRWYFGQLENRRLTKNFNDEIELSQYVTMAIHDLVKEDDGQQLQQLCEDLTAVISKAGDYL